MISENNDELDEQEMLRRWEAATKEERRAMLRGGYSPHLKPARERGCGTSLAVVILLVGVIGLVPRLIAGDLSLFVGIRAGLMVLIGLAGGLLFLFGRTRLGFKVLALTAIPIIVLSLNGRG
ncbi:hypothetical protein ACPCUV_10535 [Streptomyces platensis]|uniref:hypothetical protein n=1 Tax=Streptomyces platensis TaxID=58346 RepID=UPI003C2F9D56